MKNADLFIRPCRESDLDEILALQDAVFALLPDESLLRGIWINTQSRMPLAQR